MVDFFIKFTPLARIDLDEIWFSVAQYNLKSADFLNDRLRDKTSLLKNYSELGVLRPEIFPTARILVAEKYLIIYRVDGFTINILRVVHGARDLSELDLI